MQEHENIQAITTLRSPGGLFLRVLNRPLDLLLGSSALLLILLYGAGSG